MLLRVVGDRDRLVTRQRADHDVRTELLHEPLGLLDRRVRTVVAAADADELERVAADRRRPSSPCAGCSDSWAWRRRTPTSRRRRPPRSWSSNAPNAPLQSDRTATLIGVAEAGRTCSLPPSRRRARRRGPRKHEPPSSSPDDDSCSALLRLVDSDLPNNGTLICVALIAGTLLSLTPPHLPWGSRRPLPALVAAPPATPRPECVLRTLPEPDQAAGETRTMTRKTTPISVWKRSADEVDPPASSC